MSVEIQELLEKLFLGFTFQSGLGEAFFLWGPCILAISALLWWLWVRRPPKHKEVEYDAAATAINLADLPPIQTGSTYRAEWHIAWGHLKSKKSETFLSVVTVLAIIGVTAGVAMLNWVTAVMTGFEEDLRDKILGANAHVVIFNELGELTGNEELLSVVDNTEGVEAAAPFVYAEMMLRSDYGVTGIITKGVDPLRTGHVTHVLPDLVQGFDGEHHQRIIYGDTAQRTAFFESMGGLFPALDFVGDVIEDEPPLPGLIIGTELASNLNLGVGSRITLVNPNGGSPGPMGIPTPAVRNLRIAAIFESGMYEYDNKWTYLTNAVAQDFLKKGNKHTAIEVKVHNIDDANVVATALQKNLKKPFYARTWMDLNEKLFSALELEKWVMGLLLNMVVVNAGLLIITTLFMLVLTKTREIAILKAMGATSSGVMRIFVMEGATIGFVGSSLGTFLGLWGCELLKRYEYPLETDVYYLSTLPVVVDTKTVIVIAISSFLTAFVCTLYPAYRAANIDPVSALRYE